MELRVSAYELLSKFGQEQLYWDHIGSFATIGCIRGSLTMATDAEIPMGWAPNDSLLPVAELGPRPVQAADVS